MKLSNTLLSVVEPEDALLSVLSNEGDNVYASSDHLFRNAIFGRDSLEVAEDLMSSKRELVQSILLTLASLQGQSFNVQTEEEPGKILHEYRPLYIGGKLIDKESLSIYKDLSAKWGSEGKRMVYYGSVDSTPLFIRTLASFCGIYGAEFLDQIVTLKNGKKVSLRVVLQAAIEWLEQKLAHFPLLAYQRTNPLGIANQAWKDSSEFYLHANGTLANHKRPIASVEVQGIAYDALISGARYLPQKSAKLFKSAKALQKSVINRLWMEDEQYFALGVDHDEEGLSRLIRVKTANPASLLDSSIFDDLPQAKKHRHVSAIAKQIFSGDFLTDAGVRSRALKHSELVPYWDYHGSFVTWPKETYDIAKGLRRQGLPQLAAQLENRLLNICTISGEYLEFIYVDAEGRVIYGPFLDKGNPTIQIDSTNRPQKMQAWTISAILAIKDNSSAANIKQAQWQEQLEKELLNSISDVPSFTDTQAIFSRYPQYSYCINPPAAFAAAV